TVGYWLDVTEPKTPWLSSSGPAAKYRVVSDPEPEPFPKPMPHRPSITSGWWLAVLRWPRASHAEPVHAKALILPSPKLPTRRSPLNLPKPGCPWPSVAGAHARPHGAL